MTKKIILLLSLLFVLNYSFSNEYYEQGIRYMNTYQYSSAITQFRNAIRQEPDNYEIRISLVNAYSSRALYYFKTAKDYQKALNDSRSALFYLKYYDEGATHASLQDAIYRTESNIKEILSILKPNTTAEGLLSTAKQLRNQGELPSSFVVYQQLLDSKYDKEACIASGDILKVLKNSSLAIVYYEKALKKDAKNYDLLIKTGECYQDIGNTNTAVKYFNQALDSTENSELALNKLEETWRKQIYATPYDAAAHSNMGVIYQRRGDYDAAILEYEKAAKLKPDDTNNILNLGTLYQEEQKYDPAIAMYDKILFNDPNNLEARKYKAECLQAQGKTDLALIEYNRIMALSPNNKNLTEDLLNLALSSENPDEIISSITSSMTNNADKAKIYYSVALNYHTDKKYELAKQYYIKAKEVGFSDAELYLNLADVCYSMKQDNEAVAFLKNGTELFPLNTQLKEKIKNAEIINNNKVIEQANAAVMANNYEKAITLYKSIQPPTVDSLIGIASAYQMTDKNQEALEYYKKASILDSKNLEIQYCIASTYVELDDLNSAKMYLNKILAQKPNDTNAKNLMDYIKEQETQATLTKALDLYNAGDYQKAYDLLTAFISKYPKDAYGYYYRGLVYDAQKKYDLAIADYSNAVKNDARLDLAYYGLAVDFDLKKDYKNAHINYKRYLNTAGEENDYTIYTKKRIAELEKYVPSLAKTK